MSAPPRVLLVDDDQAFLAVTAKMLVAAGLSVDCACDAPEGLSRLRAESYDLLITDREMPGNDGLALIRNLPARSSGMPVIVVTAYPTVDSAIQALHLTVVAYVVKPFQKEELLGHVANALEIARARRLLRCSRERLDTWRHELDQLDRAMRVCPGEVIASARETWFAINLDHIRQAVTGLQAGVESAAAPAEGPPPGVTPFGLRSSEQIALLGGLRETIAVLEKTKRSFKSRELGDLRKKLETLFHAPSAPDPE